MPAAPVLPPPPLGVRPAAPAGEAARLPVEDEVVEDAEAGFAPPGLEGGREAHSLGLVRVLR